MAQTKSHPAARQGGSDASRGANAESNAKPSHPQRADDIANLRSWEPESKLDLRRRLNRIALLATARAQRAQSPDARQLFWTIALIAGQWTFATTTEEVLADMRGALIRMGMAAGALERNGSGI